MELKAKMMRKALSSDIKSKQASSSSMARDISLENPSYGVSLGDDLYGEMEGGEGGEPLNTNYNEPTKNVLLANPN